MDVGEKSEMFSDSVSELKSSLTLIQKKFSVIDKKVDDMG